METGILVVVVDGTINMAPHWNTMKTVLESIARKFSTISTLTSPDPSYGKCLVHLVTFGHPDGTKLYRGFRMESFIQNLSKLTFTDNHGDSRPSLEEGLGFALKLFPPIQGVGKELLRVKRQCILVAASEQSGLTKYVPVPNNSTPESDRSKPKSGQHIFVNAEYLAALFPKALISLSVICPREKQKLRKIFNVGNEFYQISGSSQLEFMHPELLILISEMLPGAREALRNLGENRQILAYNDPSSSMAQNFSIEQLNTIFHPPTSEGSVQQQTPKNAAEDGEENKLMKMNTVGDMKKSPDNHRENRQSSREEATFTIEKMETWPYEVVGSNFARSSTNITHEVETGNPARLDLGQHRAGLVPSALQKASSSKGGSCTKAPMISPKTRAKYTGSNGGVKLVKAIVIWSCTKILLQ